MDRSLFIAWGGGGGGGGGVSVCWGRKGGRGNHLILGEQKRGSVVTENLKGGNH